MAVGVYLGKTRKFYEKQKITSWGFETCWSRIWQPEIAKMYTGGSTRRFLKGTLNLPVDLEFEYIGVFRRQKQGNSKNK